MLNTRGSRAGIFLSKIIQILILALGISAVLFFGSTFTILDIWNEYSVLSLMFGLLAICIPIISFFKNAELRNKELDNERRNRELDNERRNKELEWKRFQVREIIIIKTAELKRLTDPWRRSDATKDPRLNLYDPENRELNQVVQNLLVELKDEIDYLIHLGDLDTAKESSSAIRLALQETPWLRYWVTISFANSDKGLGND